MTKKDIEKFLETADFRLAIALADFDPASIPPGGGETYLRVPDVVSLDDINTSIKRGLLVLYDAKHTKGKKFEVGAGYMANLLSIKLSPELEDKKAEELGEGTAHMMGLDTVPPTVVPPVVETPENVLIPENPALDKDKEPSLINTVSEEEPVDIVEEGQVKKRKKAV